MVGTNDKKRFKRALRIVQEILEDNIHGATVRTTKVNRLLKELDATLNAIRVPGDEPEVGQPPAVERVTTFERGDVPTYTKDGDRVS